MNSASLQENLTKHTRWRLSMADSLRQYQTWRKSYGLEDPNSTDTLVNIIQNLNNDRVTLAFVAEFSRGKTELINALFFGETGVRLLPSTPGRTTMCPTELFFDEAGGSYIKLLNIESRLEDIPITTLKQRPELWNIIELNDNSPEQMQEAFQELVAVKRVSKNEAENLGLYDEKLAAELGLSDGNTVEIPKWRHALISFPHDLLKEGLTILDTPGLNALGSEPELTLSMLPSAQAIIFVIAADTGVTKSDLEMWSNHVNKAAKMGRQGLAVVMNKIDAMWDELTSEAGYQKAIESQISGTAKILGLSDDFIFPVSAKQALIAKIKNDGELLKRSKLTEIEQYLSKDIIQQRQKILIDVIAQDIGFLITESFNLTENNYAKSSRQLHELKQLDFENQELIEKLMADTHNQQQKYLENLEEFKNSRQVFAAQLRYLRKALKPERADAVIKFSRHAMSSSLTTSGMKQIMRKLFDDLREILQECVVNTEATQILIKSIHKKFHDEYGFQEIEPQLFQIEQHQKALELLFEEGEEYRQSTRVALTEQSLVVKKLYETLIYKARSILTLASKEAETWGRNVMSPLMHQIIAYKKQIEDRLTVLNSSVESKDDLQNNLNRLEEELKVIIAQRNELNAIVKQMEGETSVFNKSASFLINDISRAYVDFQ